MNRKSRALLLAFAGLLLVVLAVALWPRGRGGADLKVPGWGPGLKTEKPDEDAPVDRIEVALGDRSVTLARDAAKKWSLTPPEGARVDRYKVRQILDLLKEDLVSVLPATPRADDLPSFGLHDGNRVTVTLQRVGASPVTLDIGAVQKAEGAAGEGDTFVRLAGDPRVWRVTGRDLRRPFEGGLSGLRDRKLFAFDAADVAALDLRDPAAPDEADRAIRLVSEAAAAAPAKEGETPRKPERTWHFEAPAGLAAGDVKAYVASLAGIYVQEYVDALPEGVALGPDAYAVTATLADGKAVTLRLSPLKDDSAYVQVEGSAGYAKVAKYVADQVRKHSGDLRDRRLFPTARDAIRAVEIVDGGRRLALERDGNDFRALAPAGLALGRPAVESLLTDLEGLKADSFVPPSKRAGLVTGLDAPAVTVAVVTKDGGRRVLRVGGDVGQGTRYVTVEGSGEVATLPAWALSRVRKSPDDLRNKTFFDFDPGRLASLELVHADETVLLQAAGEAAGGPAPGKRSWRAVKPREAADLKDEVMGTLVGTVAGMSAKAVASDAAARKAVSGKPEFTLTAVLDDGSRHVLKIFAEKKDGDPYAVAPGEPGFRDAVLILNAWQVSNVRKRLAEITK